MIKLKLVRDQARCIEQYLFPLMITMAKLKIREAKMLSSEYLSAAVLESILIDIDKIFKRKLLSSANNFSFSFSTAHGITLYKFLMEYPIPAHEIYMQNLRQYVCDVLHKQILKP